MLSVRLSVCSVKGGARIRLHHRLPTGGVIASLRIVSGFGRGKRTCPCASFVLFRRRHWHNVIHSRYLWDSCLTLLFFIQYNCLFFSGSWYLAVHLWEMTNFMLYLCWVLTWVDYMSGTVHVFNDTMVFSTADWFCTGSLELSSSWGLDWAFQLGPAGLLHLCQRRAVFRPSHQIIHKAKTFSFGHGKWKILMGVIPLSARLPCEAWGLRWMKLY